MNGAYVGSFSERAGSASYRKLLYVRTLDPGGGLPLLHLYTVRR